MTTIRLTMAQALVRFLIAQNSEIGGEEVPLFAGIFAIFGHGNVAGLFVDGRNYCAGVGVETIDRVVIPNGSDHAAHERLKIDVGTSADFSGNHNQTGRGQRFAGNAAIRIFRNTRV